MTTDININLTSNHPYQYTIEKQLFQQWYDNGKAYYLKSQKFQEFFLYLENIPLKSKLVLEHVEIKNNERVYTKIQDMK